MHMYTITFLDIEKFLDIYHHATMIPTRWIVKAGDLPTAWDKFKRDMKDEKIHHMANVYPEIFGITLSR